MHTILLLFLLCTVGAFIMRTTGFGFGIFVMTVLPFLLPSYGEATMLSGLFAMTLAVVVFIQKRRFITWRRFLPILLTSMVVSAIAIFSLGRFEEHELRRILGVTLIVVSIYFAAFSRRIHLPPTLTTQISMGTLSGLMGGFFSMQGPPGVLYLIKAEPDKDHYLADIQAFFLMGNIVMALARIQAGYCTMAVGQGYLFGIVGVAIGAAIGTWVFKHIPNRWFRYVVYAYIGISGIIILCTA